MDIQAPRSGPVGKPRARRHRPERSGDPPVKIKGMDAADAMLLGVFCLLILIAAIFAG